MADAQLTVQAHAAIELKDAQQNVLLGQYHMQDSSFVAAKLPRQGGRPPAAEDVRWSQQPAAGGSSAKLDLF